MGVGNDKNQPERIVRLITAKEAKIKTARYCAYQERTQQEVRDKLYKLNLSPDEVEYIIAELLEDGYINEERYAIAYARGKFSQNKWGKIKIHHGLKQKGLTEYCINKALSEIEEKEYEKMVLKLIDGKQKQLSEKDEFIKNSKIAAFLYSKGFEKDVIWKFLIE